jgi:hypothetical protein
MFPAIQVSRHSSAKYSQFVQLFIGLRERGFGHRDDAPAGLAPLTAQVQDAADFVETEAEALRFADKNNLAERGIVIHAIAAARTLCLRKKPQPLIKSDGVRRDSRELRQTADQ